MSIFSVGKSFLTKYPIFLKACSSIYNFFALNSVKGMKGNKIIKDSAFMQKCKIRINGKGNEIILGEKCRLKRCRFIITGDNNRIVLGDNVYADRCGFCMEDSKNTITIGSDTRIFGECHMAAMEGTKINLGEGCLISSDTFFRTGDSHSILDLNGNRINPSRSITLGNRVWLGQRAVILKGAGIADDTVVSTGAIVTKRFDTSNAVLAGVPAKIVKTDIKWCKERVAIKVEK